MYQHFDVTARASANGTVRQTPRLLIDSGKKADLGEDGDCGRRGEWWTHRQGDEVEGLAFEVGDAAVGDELDTIGGLHEEALVPRRRRGDGRDGDPRAGAVEDVGRGCRLDRLRAGRDRHEHPLGRAGGGGGCSEGAGEEQAAAGDGPPRQRGGGCGH